MREILATPSLCPKSRGPIADPDADLITVFAEWRRAYAVAETLFKGMTEADIEERWGRVFHLMSQMDATPARTPAGILAKALCQFASISEDKQFYDHAACGTPIDPAELPDQRVRALLGLLNDIERMGGVNV